MNSRTILAFLTLIILGILTWQLRSVLLVLFGAVIIAVALDVLINSVQTLIPLPRPIALSIVIFLLGLTGTFIFQLFVPELINQIEELGLIIPTLLEKLNSLFTSDNPLLGKTITEQFKWVNIQPLGAKLLNVAGGAANSLLQLLLVSLMAVLLVLDPEAHKKIVISLTPFPARKGIQELLTDFRLALGGWLSGMTLSAGSVFILTWAGLAILKVPLALLSALVCGVFTFVPIIGPTASTILPLGVSVLISPSLMLKVLILRISLQNLEAFLLTPILLKKTVNLLPTVALMAQLSLGALLGLPGILIAIPLAIVLQVGVQKIVVHEIMDNWK